MKAKIKYDHTGWFYIELENGKKSFRTPYEQIAFLEFGGKVYFGFSDYWEGSWDKAPGVYEVKRLENLQS